MCPKGYVCAAWNLLIPIGAARLSGPCENYMFLKQPNVTDATQRPNYFKSCFSRSGSKVRGYFP